MEPKLQFIETPWPEVYATAAQIFFDGFAFRIDWRVSHPDPLDAQKGTVNVTTAARVAFSPSVAQAVMEQLQGLLEQIAKQALDRPPTPRTAQ
jgi:hypothetical protein